jgi:hypothetical protein
MAIGDPAEAKNFKLLGHDPGAAWGGGSLVEVKNGFAYVGAVGGSSYDGAEGFTVHDVSDPTKPKRVAELFAPPGIHNHKVRIVGDDLLYVNYERIKGSDADNVRIGIMIYDITDPANPKEAGFYDMPGNGPHRFGVDNEKKLAFIPNEAEGWRNRVSWTVDISDPLKPELLSLWGMPEQDLSLNLPYEEPETMERVTQCHGPAMIRGDRMFCGFWGGGMGIADCSDLSNIKHISQLRFAPPFIGSTHTVWPIGDQPYVIVTDEARSHTNYPDSQFMWIVDIREETNPLPVATYMPDRENFFDRGKRYGAHNILEYSPSEGPWANIIFLTYFNAGLRAVDLSDPFNPKELGHYVPAMNFGEPCCQSNDIGMDEHGRLYLIDRNGAGMHILEYTG